MSKNIHDNFYFIGNNDNKGNMKNVSKTIEVGEMRNRNNVFPLSHTLEEKEENKSLKEDELKEE